MPPYASRYQDLVGLIVDGRYRVIRVLGHGGMGVVYEAEAIRLANTPCALKVLLPEFMRNPTVVDRFRQEASVVARIEHRNVVKVLDTGFMDGGRVYMAMELLRGESLSVTLRREGRLPWPRARHIILQVCRAIQAAHARNIIHRDIKPENIFRVTTDLDPDFIKVVDFGIAKVSDNGRDATIQPITATNTVIGTYAYMAYEQVCGRPIDHRIDIWALGVVLYQMLTGELPFSGENQAQIWHAISTRTPASLRSVAPDLEIPEDVEGLIGRALAKDLAHRFPAVEAFVAAVPEPDARTSAITNVVRPVLAGPVVDGHGPTQELVVALRIVDAAAPAAVDIAPLPRGWIDRCVRQARASVQWLAALLRRQTPPSAPASRALPLGPAGSGAGPPQGGWLEISEENLRSALPASFTPHARHVALFLRASFSEFRRVEPQILQLRRRVHPVDRCEYYFAFVGKRLDSSDRPGVADYTEPLLLSAEALVRSLDSDVRKVVIVVPTTGRTGEDGAERVRAFRRDYDQFAALLPLKEIIVAVQARCSRVALVASLKRAHADVDGPRGDSVEEYADPVGSYSALAERSALLLCGKQPALLLLRALPFSGRAALVKSFKDALARRKVDCLDLLDGTPAPTDARGEARVVLLAAYDLRVVVEDPRWCHELLRHLEQRRSVFLAVRRANLESIARLRKMTEPRFRFDDDTLAPLVRVMFEHHVRTRYAARGVDLEKNAIQALLECSGGYIGVAERVLEVALVRAARRSSHGPSGDRELFPARRIKLVDIRDGVRSLAASRRFIDRYARILTQIERRILGCLAQRARTRRGILEAMSDCQHDDVVDAIGELKDAGLIDLDRGYFGSRRFSLVVRALAPWAASGQTSPQVTATKLVVTVEPTGVEPGAGSSREPEPPRTTAAPFSVHRSAFHPATMSTAVPPVHLFQLNQFFRSAFESDELRRFLAYHYAELSPHFPAGSLSLDGFVDAVIGLLVRFNCIDAQLFDLLTQRFPRRDAEVDQLRAACKCPPRPVPRGDGLRPLLVYVAANESAARKVEDRLAGRGILVTLVNAESGLRVDWSRPGSRGVLLVSRAVLKHSDLADELMARLGAAADRGAAWVALVLQGVALPPGLVCPTIHASDRQALAKLCRVLESRPRALLLDDSSSEP